MAPGQRPGDAEPVRCEVEARKEDGPPITNAERQAVELAREAA